MKTEDHGRDNPQRSTLATVSAVLGLIALALAVAVLLVLDDKIVTAFPLLYYVVIIAVVFTGFGWLCIPYIFLSGVLTIVSVIYSIAGLRQIARSAGEVTGARFAWVGMVASCFAGIILQHVGIPHF